MYLKYTPYTLVNQHSWPEKGPFEDVFPIENSDIPASYERGRKSTRGCILNVYWMFENRICFLFLCNFLFSPQNVGRLGTSELPWSLWSSAWLPFAEKARRNQRKGSDVSHEIYGQIIPIAYRRLFFLKAGSVFCSGPMISEDWKKGGNGTCFWFQMYVDFCFPPHMFYFGPWYNLANVYPIRSLQSNQPDGQKAGALLFFHTAYGRVMSHESWGLVYIFRTSLVSLMYINYKLIKPTCCSNWLILQFVDVLLFVHTNCMICYIVLDDDTLVACLGLLWIHSVEHQAAEGFRYLRQIWAMTSSPWWFLLLYTGWRTTQLYGDSFISHYKDLYEPISMMECQPRVLSNSSIWWAKSEWVIFQHLCDFCNSLSQWLNFKLSGITLF